MKKTIVALMAGVIFGCTSNEQSLIGKWKKTEQHVGGNAGEKAIVEKISAGKTYTFGKDNKLSVLADGIHDSGVYEVIKEKKYHILHVISLNRTETFDQYFRIHFVDSTKMDKMAFVPIHPDNEIMYSAGRTDIYEKLE
ncbi:hypothetical protein [Flavobacterium pallidum]|uniref:Lipocalin-like domain-containing protein n=1 Tax=Flavobacterium pallidum TaxID=2172098 RepID=A0A2S1SF16_9FLAO|nr:hypothetical protein [Flavobacterium pallidum]AWI25003.1 hypothetical protein HYN49_03340 [Flavobacterium pallidum]